MTRFLIFLSVVIVLGCTQKENDKSLVIDVSRPFEYSFIGEAGESLDLKLNGTFSGSVKVAITASGNELTPGNFAIFKDSLKMDYSGYKINQDGLGLKCVVQPNGEAKGEIKATIIEHRNAF